MKKSLQRRHALLVRDGAFSHKIDYIKDILDLLKHLNCITGSRVSAILLNGWILSIDRVELGRVCDCSLCSRLVLVRRLPFNRRTDQPTNRHLDF